MRPGGLRERKSSDSAEVRAAAFQSTPPSDRLPSTARIWPVMNCGAVAKNRTAAAISSARPLRCMGVCFAMRRIKAARRLLAQIDHAWRNRVHCDFRSQRLRHHFRQHVQGGFRGAVMRVRGPGPQAAEGAHVMIFASMGSARSGRFRRIHFSASRETRNGPRVLEAKIASHWRTVRRSKSAVA